MMNHKKCLTATVLCAIVFASHGIARAEEASGVADVTKTVQQAVQGNALYIVANDDALGDPAPTTIKKLKVDYTLNGGAESKAVMEYSTLKIQPAKGTRLVVTKAVYGDLTNERKIDVTVVLSEAILSDKISMIVTNESLHGDPSPGGGKTLEVHYTVGGKACMVSVGEAETLTLPLPKDGSGTLVIVSGTYGSL